MIEGENQNFRDKSTLGGAIMLFSDIVPFIRFAEIIHYESDGYPVYVRDCRIFYVLSGEAKICIGDHTYPMRAHTVFFCCSGSKYTISSSGIDLICVNFDLTQDNRGREQPYSPVRLSGTDALPPAGSCFVEDLCVLNQHILFENGISCRELLEGILGEFSTRRIHYRESASALLKALLVQLLRGSMESVSQSVGAVEKIIDHIHTHYSEPMSNALFSRLTGYHEYYLNRLFTRYTGSTIRQYILDVRITHAKKILLNTDLPISDIAEKVGFSNTYFSTYFRQTTGLSPTQFRKKHKNTL